MKNTDFITFHKACDEAADLWAFMIKNQTVINGL